FDYERIPDNMRWWLSQYDLQISQAIKEVKAGINSVARQAQTRAERAEIPIMLTTIWGQDKPYNQQLPTSQRGAVDLPVGCGPTAIAQIMKYHRWPESGIGSKTLDEKYYGYTFTADFVHALYDWESMKDSYYTIYNDTWEEVSVGRLMYHLGVAFNAKYNKSGTAVYDINVAKGLTTHFRYNKGISFLRRLYFTDAEWEEIVYDELRAGRPLYYAGDTETDLGHAFVCDGYKEGHWHINWGWNGLYNNYFLITPIKTKKALLPGGTGTGGGSANDNYAKNQRIITGIYPDRDGSTQYKKVLFFSLHQLKQSLCAGGETISLSMNFSNQGLQSEMFEIGYKLVNVDDADDSCVIDDIYSLTLASSERQSFETSLNLPVGLREGATYQVIPIYKDENGKWLLTQKELSQDYPSIQIADGLQLIEPLCVDNDGNACKEVFGVSFTIKNFSDRTMTSSLVIDVCSVKEENDTLVDYFNLGEIILDAYEERQIRVGAEDLHFGDRLVIGEDYSLQIKNNTDKTPFGRPVKFSYVDSRTISLTVPEIGWTTFASPFDAEIPKGMNVYRIDYVSKGDSLILQKQDCLVRHCAYLIHGVPGTYQFIGPALENTIAHLGNLYSNNVNQTLVASSNYVLDYRDNIIGFYKIYAPTHIGQYEAFLKVLSSKDMLTFLDPDAEDPTSLQQI
ncbi:MAG: C10 family peptidase, partial [Bacteroidaceae bacterium]|nr:C10 family peptidase [Bacteroidaceae bacterium]